MTKPYKSQWKHTKAMTIFSMLPFVPSMCCVVLCCVMFVTWNTDLRLMRAPSSHHFFLFLPFGLLSCCQHTWFGKIIIQFASANKEFHSYFPNKTRFISFALDEPEHVEAPNSSHDKKAREINGNYGKFIFFFCWSLCLLLLLLLLPEQILWALGNVYYICRYLSFSLFQCMIIGWIVWLCCGFLVRNHAELFVTL